MMTEESLPTPEAKKILELYDMMESKLEELGISFDEFIILYKAFKGALYGDDELKPVKGNDNSNPFPWVKSAGVGWS